MRSKKQVRNDFNQSTKELLATINDVPETHFNDQPADGGWSAGQIAEHLIKSEIGLVRYFNEQTAPVHRDPEEKIESLEKTFLNFDSKLKAGCPIVPDEKLKEKQKVIDKLQDMRQRLTGLIEIEDLTRLITAFDHPLAGPLTRIEWLYFHIYHSKRHCKQIKRL